MPTPVPPCEPGAAGVDGQTFEDIEAYGRRAVAGRTGARTEGEDLSTGGGPAGVYPKGERQAASAGDPHDPRPGGADGGGAGPGADLRRATCRRSNTPTDRTAAPTQAVREVQACWIAGYTEVVDADLSGYFDSIPHHELMKCVARRISDRHLLHLIKMWLEAPVEETDERGRTQANDPNQGRGRGTPQGGVASPLLANLYMRRFVLGWKRQGVERQLRGAHRQLCGRLRDLLSSGQGRRGDGGDAAR